MKNSLKLKRILIGVKSGVFTEKDINELRLIGAIAREISKQSFSAIKTIKRNVDEENKKNYPRDARWVMSFVDGDGVVKYFTDGHASYKVNNSDSIADACIFVGYWTAMGFRSFSNIRDIKIIPAPPVVGKPAYD